MKLLLVAENVWEPRDANGNCVWNLARAMARGGHEVHLLSVTPRRRTEREHEGIRLHWLYMPWDLPLGRAAGVARKAGLAAVKVCNRLVLSRCDRGTLARGAIVPYWANAIRKTVREQRFDGMLVCFFPIEPALACARSAEKGERLPPYWVYQVDAYAANAVYPERYRPAKEALEKRAFGKAAGVFTTPLLLDDLRRRLPERARDIIPVEFPLLTPPPAPKTVPARFAQGEISCVFAGRLYEGLRSPEYLLRLFAASKVPNVRLHLFLTNRISEGAKASWQALAGGKAVLHPALPLEEMLPVLGQASCLVNLGNAVPNMLPSKLWDYIASGRPIIDLAQTESCPTLPYLQKHPAALTLFTGSDVGQAAAKLDAFLAAHGDDAALPFDTLAALYPRATPQAVAKTVLDRLSGKHV